MFTGPNITNDGLVLSLDARNFKSYKRDYNLIDYSTWSLGTGSVTGFGRNGTDAENHRIIDTDPWGNEIIVWEARPEGNNSSDGGWNGSRFDIDNTKTYRFSTWMRRTVNTDPDSYYLGTKGYGSVDGVKNQYNDATNTNPYFMAGSWTFPDNEWVLLVGHVHPHTYSGSKHVDTGAYKVDGTHIVLGSDFIWLPETTESVHRSYAYYINDTTTRQQWCYPRVDLCDGNEPSIDELLGADTKRWKDLYAKDIFDVIGPKWNPEGYFSFRGQGTKDGLIKGDRIAGFGGKADTSLYPNGMSIVWWQRFTDNQPTGHALLYGHGTINHVEIRGDLNNNTSFRTEAKNQNGYSFGSGTIPGGPLMNRWVQFGIVFDFTTSPRSVRWYANGELFHTHTDFDSGTAGTGEHFSFSEFGRATGVEAYQYSQSFKGDLAKLDIFGKPLTNNDMRKNFNAFRKRFDI
jgi:hypothetical protein